MQTTDKNSQLLLSIVIPVYNVEPYLDACLSPLKNLSDEIELVIVNDGSTDNSLEILQAYSTNRPNTVLIDQENTGLSAARNVGLSKASGEFLFFLDSDDVVLPENLLTSCREAKQLHLDILQCQAEVFCGEQTLRILRPPVSRQESIVLSGTSYYCHHVKSGEFPIPVWNNIFSNHFLKDNALKFLTGVIHEDEEFTPKAFMLAKRASFKNCVIYRYRVRDDSITGTHRFSNARTIPSFLKISQQYVNLLNNDTLSEEQRETAFMVLIKCYVSISRCFSSQQELLPPQLSAQIKHNNHALRNAIPHWWTKLRLLRYFAKNRKLGIE